MTTILYNHLDVGTITQNSLSLSLSYAMSSGFMTFYCLVRQQCQSWIMTSRTGKCSSVFGCLHLWTELSSTASSELAKVSFRNRTKKSSSKLVVRHMEILMNWWKEAVGGGLVAVMSGCWRLCWVEAWRTLVPRNVTVQCSRPWLGPSYFSI